MSVPILLANVCVLNLLANMCVLILLANLCVDFARFCYIYIYIYIYIYCLECVSEFAMNT